MSLIGSTFNSGRSFGTVYLLNSIAIDWTKPMNEEGRGATGRGMIERIDNGESLEEIEERVEALQEEKKDK